MTPKEFFLLPRQWQWGGCDCHLYPSDWVREVTGRDPAASWRGTYSDEAGAHALLDRLGGTEALTARVMARDGFELTSAPVDGDIGLVAAPIGVEALKRIIPAVKFGPLWGVMSLRGPQVKHLEWTEAAWRIA